MKRYATFTGYFAVGVLLAGALYASDTVSPNNPYSLIITRNVFGLNPPPPPGPAEPAEPPPKITPNGIMSIFGNLQALYKVSVNVPGKPPQEKSYMLTEGQREDDIEVVKIDEKNAIITFDNHGTIQELPLANGQASGGDSGPGGMPPRPTFAGFNGNRFANNPAFNNAIAFRNRMRANNEAPNDNDGQNGFNNGYNGGNSRIYNPANDSNQMTPEEQAALIALQHLQAQQQNSPTAPLFPSTPVDKEAGIAP